jgi:hypothetical protein
VAGRIHFLAWDWWGAVTHERYDPALDAWTVFDPPPDSAEVLHAVGDLLYMVGATGATWAFDPASGVWSTRAPMITPRWDAASTVLDGRIHVAGAGTGGPMVLTKRSVTGAPTTNATMPRPTPGAHWRRSPSLAGASPPA